MSGFINKINDFMRKFPKTRAFVIKTIYYSRCFVYRTKNIFTNKKSGFLVEFKRLTPQKKHCFFGYYDKSPYSFDDKYILYHEILKSKSPIRGEKASLFIHEIESDNRKKLGDTLAWNLQQGAMLRFYDKNIVSWNDFRNGKYCCVFHSLLDDTEKTIDYPLYDVSSDGKYGLSLEFERLNIDVEGYGYIQEGKIINNFNSPAFISLIDIKNNSESIIIKSDLLNNLFPIKHTDVSFFYFNHLCFNPTGNRFLFIERYEFNHKRYSRLFSSDLSGSDIRLIADEDMVSHFAWIDDESFLLFCRKDGIDAYYIVVDKQKAIFTRIENKALMTDGHPTFFEMSGERCFLSDTYPLKDRYRELFVFNMESNKRILLARLSSPIKYDGPTRCDLHPRLSRAKCYACVDSIHEGFRGIYQVSLRNK